jgi:hypothetical protein
MISSTFSKSVFLSFDSGDGPGKGAWNVKTQTRRRRNTTNKIGFVKVLRDYPCNAHPTLIL